MPQKGCAQRPQPVAPVLLPRSAVPSKLWVSDKRIEGIVSQRDAVGESVPAVEESSPAVEESVHGVEESVHGARFYSLPPRKK